MTNKSARLMPLGSSNEVILDEWEKITQTAVEESQKKDKQDSDMFARYGP